MPGVTVEAVRQIPEAIFAGFCIRPHETSVQIALGYHPTLGMSPMVIVGNTIETLVVFACPPADAIRLAELCEQRAKGGCETCSTRFGHLAILLRAVAADATDKRTLH